MLCLLLQMGHKMYPQRVPRDWFPRSPAAQEDHESANFTLFFESATCRRAGLDCAIGQVQSVLHNCCAAYVRQTGVYDTIKTSNLLQHTAWINFAIDSCCTAQDASTSLIISQVLNLQTRHVDPTSLSNNVAQHH